MQTSVIGFPRIGTLRELKFASEKYFKKEIEAGELLQKAQELRKTHWLTQKNAGITYISSNDFSFYDMVLDTAALLGIVPKRYKELNLSELDTYFAMARGYQGTFGDVIRIIITLFRNWKMIQRSKSREINYGQNMRKQRALE